MQDTITNNLITLPIKEIKDEVKDIKTFYFDFELKSKPGQFVMLWIPDVDQKPFSIGYDNGKKFGLTIFKRGRATEKLFEMKAGDKVGISGPYGTNFSVKDNTHYIIVAGGYGSAPLAFLAEKLQKKENVTIDFCIGSRNKDLLLFEERLKKLKNINLHIATDDGSQGHHGFVTDLLPSLLEKETKQNKLTVTCGPEIMEKKVLEACNEYNIDCEISLERYMKCGIGVCGQCCVDPLGICMCKEGPVLSRELVNKITEFGKYHRDKSGKKIY